MQEKALNYSDIFLYPRFFAGQSRSEIDISIEFLGRRFATNFLPSNMASVLDENIATDEEIKDALGRVVSFGSALGKHSDIYGDLEEKDLEVVSEDQNFIQQFSECIGCSFGYNPLEYILE